MLNKIVNTVFSLAIIASVFICANVANAQIAEKGLISYWTFDEADIDGEILKDIMGNHDGTIVDLMTTGQHTILTIDTTRASIIRMNSNG